MLNHRLRQLKQAMSKRSDAAIRQKVKELVPEYSPKDGAADCGAEAKTELATDSGTIRAAVATP
jgi:hypothetical protein